MQANTLQVVAIDAPKTVAAARHWLRNELGRFAPASGVRDLAELVLSELVTNAVLHSPGPMRVSLSRRGDCLAIEVVDAEAGSLPTARTHFSDEATTGRGLHVVERCSAAWGVRALTGGKGVWAVLADPERPAAASRCADQFDPATWLLDDPTTPAPPPAPTAGTPQRTETVTVIVEAVPLTVYFAAQEHNEALMREFRLLSAHHGADSVPSRLVALAAEARQEFAAEGTQLRAQVESAVARGSATVDLELNVPRVGWELLGRLVRLLDEADEFCERGELLTLASPPIVRRFRAWYLGEIWAQLEGGLPGSWPGEGPAGEGPAGDDLEERP